MPAEALLEPWLRWQTRVSMCTSLVVVLESKAVLRQFPGEASFVCNIVRKKRQKTQDDARMWIIELA